MNSHTFYRTSGFRPAPLPIREILEKWFIVNSEPCCISLPFPKLINLRPYYTCCSKLWTRSSIIVTTYSLAEDERFELPCSFPRPLSRRVLYQLSESSIIYVKFYTDGTRTHFIRIIIGICKSIYQ